MVIDQNLNVSVCQVGMQENTCEKPLHELQHLEAFG